MEDAGSHSAITEECHADLVGLLDATCQGRPARDSQTIADNGIGAEVAASHVGNVHRTALPSAIPILPSENLGHHWLEIAAFGDAVPVPTMCAGDIVVRLESEAGTHGHCFFARIEVDRPPDLAF